MTDRWREHGLDLHIPDLTYPGEHTDVAAYLQAPVGTTATSALADLFDSAGLGAAWRPTALGIAGPAFDRSSSERTRR